MQTFSRSSLGFSCYHDTEPFLKVRDVEEGDRRSEVGEQPVALLLLIGWNGLILSKAHSFPFTGQRPRVKTGIIFSALGIDNQPSVRYILLNLTKCELE